MSISINNNKVALVTGANKGIGFCICELLSEHNDLTVIVAAREESRGKQAVDKLINEGAADVEFLKVDIDDEKSIAEAAEIVERKYGGLDILVNNAGIAWKGDAFDETVARGTFKTNYYGTLHMLQTFIPLMRPGGRIVNVSSMAGRSALRNMSEPLRKQFLDQDLSIERLNELMEQFIVDVRNNEWQQKGWPKTAYGVSKAGVSMMTRILAKQLKDDVVMNACCPGWCHTDMAGPRAPKSPLDGARTPVHCALLPATLNQPVPNGKFFEDEQIKDWI